MTMLHVYWCHIDVSWRCWWMVSDLFASSQWSHWKLNAGCTITKLNSSKDQLHDTWKFEKRGLDGLVFFSPSPGPPGLNSAFSVRVIGTPAAEGDGPPPLRLSAESRMCLEEESMRCSVTASPTKHGWPVIPSLQLGLGLAGLVTQPVKTESSGHVMFSDPLGRHTLKLTAALRDLRPKDGSAFLKLPLQSSKTAVSYHFLKDSVSCLESAAFSPFLVKHFSMVVRPKCPGSRWWHAAASCVHRSGRAFRRRQGGPGGRQLDTAGASDGWPLAAVWSCGRREGIRRKHSTLGGEAATCEFEKLLWVTQTEPVFLGMSFKLKTSRSSFSMLFPVRNVSRAGLFTWKWYLQGLQWLQIRDVKLSCASDHRTPGALLLGWCFRRSPEIFGLWGPWFRTLQLWAARIQGRRPSQKLSCWFPVAAPRTSSFFVGFGSQKWPPESRHALDWSRAWAVWEPSGRVKVRVVRFAFNTLDVVPHGSTTVVRFICHSNFKVWHLTCFCQNCPLRSFANFLGGSSRPRIFLATPFEAIISKAQIHQPDKTPSVFCWSYIWANFDLIFDPLTVFFHCLLGQTPTSCWSRSGSVTETVGVGSFMGGDSRASLELMLRFPLGALQLMTFGSLGLLVNRSRLGQNLVKKMVGRRILKKTNLLGFKMC